MLLEMLKALFFIFIAEMGDKTQILAMMFATRYKVNKVLLGIFIGSLLNHGLAVAFGSYMGQFVPIYILQMIAAIAFIGFAIWTFIGEDEEEDVETVNQNHTAVVTVAMAFFLGELGDKTQLTAITLAVDAVFPWAILIGTVSGMILTSSIGIFVGSKLGNRVSDSSIKLASGCIFSFFGITKLVTVTPEHLVSTLTIVIFIAFMVLLLLAFAKAVYRKFRVKEVSVYQEIAQELYDYVHTFRESVDNICRSDKHCGECVSENCAIGLIRHLLEDLENNQLDHDHEEIIQSLVHEHNKFSKKKLEAALLMTVQREKTMKATEPGYIQLTEIRKVIEGMLKEKA